MASENTLPDTALPVKVAEPDVSAPPTLAEPASGPAAEMSGALASGVADAKSESNPPKAEVNGAGDSSAVAPSNDSTVDAAAAPVPSTEPATDTPAVAEAASEAPAQEKATAPISEEKADEATADTNGDADADAKKSGKRKSSAGVPEHKGKKLSKKKSIAKITHLDAQPGDHFFARLRSYPPWPAIICNEVMLPSSLLSTRPVTAAKADGSYNESYAEGGKKVNERTYPIMFLYTNEFAWIPNTDLGDLDPEQCKNVPEKGKSKSLLAAYEVAGEHHDLEYFENMLAEHAKAMEEDEIRRQEAAEAKANKSKDKKKRKSDAKSKATVDDDDDEDIEMVDVEESTETKKASKKRKKAAESDEEEAEKPAKTPKTTKLKLTTNKTPATTEKKPKEKPAKAKGEKRKSKAAPADEDEEMADAPEQKPPLDPAEEKKAREKEVLFLRHKLQKGFLSRDQAPQEEDMPQMSSYIKKLEDYEEIEVSIIRTTKINKVLKALVKLNTIPRDEEFAFRQRSVDLLGKWNKALGAEPADAADDKETAKSTPATNGVHEDGAEEKKEDKEAKPETTEDAAPESGKDEVAPAAETKTETAPEPETTARLAESTTDAPKQEAPAISAQDEPEKPAESTATSAEAVAATE